MKELIAVDGNSLMHRAFYALPPMVTKDGVPTGAIFGFVRMLLKLIERKPDYMLVAFDMHTPTFRHEKYDDYKGGRKATPDDLRTQFPLIRQLLTSMGVAVIECERFEADDILGTFSRIANENGVNALLVTGDRDALQLVSDTTHVLMTKKGISETVEYDRETLFNEYGLEPARMVDLKGLMGDNSDNLPGVPGVGEKTALSLLSKYGTMQNALDNAANEKGALQRKLTEGRESALMTYELGTITREAPVRETLLDCAFDSQRLTGGIPMMNELELRSIVETIKQTYAEAAGFELEEVCDAPEFETIRVNTADGLEKAAAELNRASRLAFFFGDAVYLAADEKKEYVVSLGGTLLEPGLDEASVIDALAPALENAACEKLTFDAKRAAHMAAKRGLTLRFVKFDAMIADYLLNAIHPADSYRTLYDERGGDARFGRFSACALFDFERRMSAELEAKGMTRLYADVELPLENVLFDMERCGFTIDTDALAALGKQFRARIAEIEGEIYKRAGGEFNILSPKQLGTVLFETLGLPPQKKNKSGYSTDAEVLEKLAPMHPIVPLINEYRFLSKLKSTFIDGLLALVSRDDGKVRTSFNQTITATGRISSTEPNLQNIPVRTELGREIRRAFVASPGNVLVGADYSQIELRLLAHMSGDERMIEAFNSGEDIHRRTASEVFSVPLAEVTKEQRAASKAVNFGIVYGISDFGLAKNLSISKKQAQEYIDMYLARYSGVDRYMHESIERAKKRGYAETLMGRRRDLPELRSGNFNTRSFGERVAMNMPIQGTAADIIKLAMVRVHDTLEEEGLSAKLILQIHDELIIDTPVAECERVKEILSACMQNVMKLSVPLIADVEVGRSWFDTK